jgi:formylglycine-generating enzyme required for sulfatase activity
MNLINWGDTWEAFIDFPDEVLGRREKWDQGDRPRSDDSRSTLVSGHEVAKKIRSISLYGFDRTPIRLVTDSDAPLRQLLPPELIASGVVRIRVEVGLDAHRDPSEESMPCDRASISLEVPIKDLVEGPEVGNEAPALPAQFRFRSGEPLEAISEQLCLELRMRSNSKLLDDRRIVLSGRTEQVRVAGFTGYPESFSNIVVDKSWTVPCPAGLVWGGSKQGCGAETRPPKPVDGRGPRMLVVPGGPFDVGPDEDDPYPKRRRVELRTFLIDETPVTRKQYHGCMRLGACTEPHDAGYHSEYWRLAEVPVDSVRFAQAVEFCRWAGRRLPSEEEWERAARGTDGRIYPWGNSEPVPATVCADNNSDTTRACTVGAHPAADAPSGAKDLVCNVAQWSSSKWCTASTGSVGCEDDERVVRGGDVLDARRAGYADTRPESGGYKPESSRPCRATRRGHAKVESFEFFLGFRCAADAPERESGPGNGEPQPVRRAANGRKRKNVQ